MNDFCKIDRTIEMEKGYSLEYYDKLTEAIGISDFCEGISKRLRMICEEVIF